MAKNPSLLPRLQALGLIARLALAAVAGLGLGLLLWAGLVPNLLPPVAGALLLAISTLLPPLLIVVRSLQRALARATAFAEAMGTNSTRLDVQGGSEERALYTALNRIADTQAGQAAAAWEGEKRTRAVFESALDCIISVDNGGRISEFNPAAERTFGYRREEVIGQDMSTVLLPMHLMSRHIEHMQAYQEGHASEILGQRRSVMARRRNGEEFPAEVAVIAGNASGRREFTVWLRDITETREAADAMLKARIAAEDANRAKSDFLANMSHEIRTPLNAIIGITELVLDTELSRDQREYLNLVRGSGDALLNIINELLDYSKIEAGHLSFEHIEFSLRHTVAMAMRALAPKAGEQRLELLIHVDPKVPDALLGDPHRLRQVITNLVGNAIKFTPSGEIEIHVSQLPVQEDGSAMLQFDVLDTGIGIPRDKLRVIFDAFTQVDTSITRKFGAQRCR